MKRKEASVKFSKKEINPVGWNTFYSQKHWSNRSKMKKKWHAFFEIELLIQNQKVTFDTFGIYFKVNSRHDIDNVGAMVKFFVDTLKEMGWIKDDSPSFFKKLTIESDKENLEKDNFQITVYEI